jgi:hypothetical protein
MGCGQGSEAAGATSHRLQRTSGGWCRRRGRDGERKAEERLG